MSTIFLTLEILGAYLAFAALWFVACARYGRSGDVGLGLLPVYPIVSIFVWIFDGRR